MINRKFFFLLFIVISTTTNLLAQNEDYGINDTINKDELGVVTDRFQEMFFQALGQRAVENNQRAITILKSLESTAPDKVAVNFELGKNYYQLEEYDNAERHFLVASNIKSKDTDILHQLLKVYRQTGNANQGIKIAEQLSQDNKKYYVDLAEFQMRKKDYSSALSSLDQTQQSAETASADSLRRVIYHLPESRNAAISFLEKKIKNQPSNTRAYSDLILLYDSTGKGDKAQTAALSLIEKDPDAPAAHLILYKDYLDKGDYDRATASMKLILESYSLDDEIKNRVAADFSSLAGKNPQLEEAFTEAVSGSQSELHLSEHYKDKDGEKAIEYLEKALREDPNNYKLIRETLELKIQVGQYVEASAMADEKLELFPTQALLYLYKGRAENVLKNYKKAEESLDTGLDFIIENEELEYQFYKELITAWQGLGQSQKATDFQKKADKLEQKIKK